MTRALGFIVIVLLASAAPSAWAQGDLADRIAGYRNGTLSTRATADLRRGINFGDAMDAPREGAWGWRLSASDFRTVKQAGFDHVRVPMRVSAHAHWEPPYRILDDFLRRIDWVIDQALSNDLGVVLDMHHYEEIMDEPHAHADRLVSLWRTIATRYVRLPRSVAFEILNEPTRNLTAEIWNPILARAIADIRAIDPDRLLIIEGANWASARDMRDTLQFPQGDANLIASFHMYQPVYFTHQGAHWMADEFATTGVVFPGPPAKPIEPAPEALATPHMRTYFERYNTEPEETNPGGPAAVIEQMNIAKEFADRTGMRVYLGEFGVIIKADAASRARWTRLGASRRRSGASAGPTGTTAGTLLPSRHAGLRVNGLRT